MIMLEKCPFDYWCPAEWRLMKISYNPKVRMCRDCLEDIYFCKTFRDAKAKAKRQDYLAFYVSEIDECFRVKDR